MLDAARPILRNGAPSHAPRFTHQAHCSVFPCNICQSPLTADESMRGQAVRCPNCRAVLKVPLAERQPAREAVAVGAEADAYGGAPAPPPLPQSSPRAGGISPAAQGYLRGSGSNKRYGFNCGYCSSRLEATESMAATEGQCPTCGSNIVIPILDRYGRLIDPMTGKIIKQDPHPVHAYAAAGDRAPAIFRRDDGAQAIRCPRCASVSPITSNNCKSCGMPFTMEGTTLEAGGSSNGYSVASLVLGLIGIPAACTLIVPALAILFGILGLNASARAGAEAGGRGMAIAGIVCGLVGALFAAMLFLR